MATVADHLVGRAAELGEVDAALDRLASRGASPILVTGEPGIGKSRLLAEVLARADRRGFVVLSGSASELEADLPFWIFVDALEEYVAGLDSRRLASLDPDVRAELGLVFPTLSDRRGAHDGARLDERYRTHRAVRELLEALTATKPLVLLLDDLHWADPASLDLLAALLRRPPTASVLLVMAVRPNQMAERLVAAANRADRDGVLMRLDLRPLRREEAAELLGTQDGAAIETLYHLSGGNPFYLEQLARSPKHGSGRAPAAASVTMAGIDVPPMVAGSVSEELRLLKPDARRILEGASIAGDPFEPELAGAAAGADQTVALAGLDELLEVGLIRQTDVPRRFRFRHPLIRRAVYEAAAGAWVLAAHGRCADALAARGASPALRAHHVEYAARHGDAAAISLLVEAAGDAAPRAPATAARWYGAALRLLPATTPAAQRIALLNARAGLLAATGQLAAARELLLESVGVVSEEDIATRIRLTAACAGIEHLLGRHGEARARLAAALERVPEGASREAVALKLELASQSVFDTDYAAMRTRAADALDGARPLGDPALTATAAALLAMADACLGDIPAATAHHAEATALVDAMPDSQLAARLQAIGFLAHCELYLDRYVAALAHARRGAELARATGQVSPTLVPALLTALSMCGPLAEAEELVDRALESARLSQIPQAIAWTLVNCSFAALSAGATDRALAYARESLDHSEGHDNAFAAAWAGLSLAAALAATGDTARADEVLLAKAGGAGAARLSGELARLRAADPCALPPRRGPAQRRAAIPAARAGHGGGTWPAHGRRVGAACRGRGGARRRCSGARRRSGPGVRRVGAPRRRDRRGGAVADAGRKGARTRRPRGRGPGRAGGGGGDA